MKKATGGGAGGGAGGGGSGGGGGGGAYSRPGHGAVGGAPATNAAARTEGFGGLKKARN